MLLWSSHLLAHRGWNRWPQGSPSALAWLSKAWQVGRGKGRAGSGSSRDPPTSGDKEWPAGTNPAPRGFLQKNAGRSRSGSPQSHPDPCAPSSIPAPSSQPSPRLKANGADLVVADQAGVESTEVHRGVTVAAWPHLLHEGREAVQLRWRDERVHASDMGDLGQGQ